MGYIADGKTIPEKGALVIPKKEQERKQQQKKAREKYESVSIKVRNNTKKHGGFTFLRVENALSTLNPATVGRLAYLSTYLSFGNQLLLRSKDRAMLKNDLPEVLQINRTSANNFFNECESAGLIEDRGKEGLFLNDVFFRNASEDKEIVKLYRTTIQQLYKMTLPKYHQYFGLVVQCVKYINREYNIFVNNDPAETDSEKIDPMSLKQLCEKMNFEYSHAKRLKDALLGLSFEYEGRKQALCAIVSVNTEQGRQDRIIVNPHLIFFGTNPKKVEGIGVLFKPCKSTEKMQHTKNKSVKTA